MLAKGYDDKKNQILTVFIGNALSSLKDSPNSP